MNGILRTMRGKAATRGGLTLIEVLIALGVFLVGAVSVMGLFVTATRLHSEAVKRRTASFIAQELLAEVSALPAREVFATTRLDIPGGGPLGDDPDADVVVPVLGTTTRPRDRTADPWDDGAYFDQFPPPYQTTGRPEGALLIDGEWMWYDSLNEELATFGVHRGKWRSPAREHEDGTDLLQPRTWVYVLEDQDGDDTNNTVILLDAGDTTVLVSGDPSRAGADFPPLASQYIVIDQEWIRYGSVAPNEFQELDRGLAHTPDVSHPPGTPVTVAWEHPNYPGYYCTVQFYPCDAAARQARVVVSVAYGSPQNLQGAHFFFGAYTPAKY